MRIRSTFLGMMLLVAASAPSTASALSGSVKVVVKPHSKYTTTDKYDAGYNIISVNGDGSTGIDCYVYDSDGKLVISDTNPGDWCSLQWNPKNAAYFKLVLVNLGDEENRCKIAVN